MDRDTLVQFIALAQPWLLGAFIWWYRTRHVKGAILIHPSGKLQVSFGPFGPSVALAGSLQADRRDQFVKGIELLVTNLETGSNHIFRWKMVGSAKLILNQGVSSEMSMPSGFTVSTQQGYSYFILFTDIDLEEPHFHRIAQELQAEWMTRIAAFGLWTAEQIEKGELPWPTAEELQKTVTDLYSKYLVGSDQYLKAVDAITDHFYWSPGTYRLKVRVNTSRPDNTFSGSWSFGLSQFDSDRLKANVPMAIAEICSQLHWPYYNAYPNYEDSTRD